MIYAERGNKVCQIGEADIERYVSQGYTILDNTGKTIRECIPTDMASLKLAYVKNAETISALKEEISALKAELDAIKATKARTTTKKEKVEQ